MSVNASEPIVQVEVVSFSGKTVKTYHFGGLQKFDINLQELPREKLVLVFRSKTGRATANVEL